MSLSTTVVSWRCRRLRIKCRRCACCASTSCSAWTPSGPSFFVECDQRRGAGCGRTGPTAGCAGRPRSAPRRPHHPDGAARSSAERGPTGWWAACASPKSVSPTGRSGPGRSGRYLNTPRWARGSCPAAAPKKRFLEGQVGHPIRSMHSDGLDQSRLSACHRLAERFSRGGPARYGPF